MKTKRTKRLISTIPRNVLFELAAQRAKRNGLELNSIHVEVERARRPRYGEHLYRVRLGVSNGCGRLDVRSRTNDHWPSAIEDALSTARRLLRRQGGTPRRRQACA